MQQVNRHSSVPLYRQVADTIERAIAAGELAPGDPLPIESELAEQHRVNRLTVRQALADLSPRGVINTAPGRGSFVSHAPIRHTISGDREASLTRAMRESGHEVRQQLLRAQRDDDGDARRALRTRGHLRRFDLLRF